MVAGTEVSENTIGSEKLAYEHKLDGIQPQTITSVESVKTTETRMSSVMMGSEDFTVTDEHEHGRIKQQTIQTKEEELEKTKNVNKDLVTAEKKGKKAISFTNRNRRSFLTKMFSIGGLTDKEREGFDHDHINNSSLSAPLETDTTLLQKCLDDPNHCNEKEGTHRRSAERRHTSIGLTTSRRKSIQLERRKSQTLLGFLGGVDLEEEDAEEEKEQATEEKPGEKRQRRRSSFFDPASTSIRILKKCAPTPPPSSPAAFPTFHLGGEMMYCCAVSTTPAIALVETDDNDDKNGYSNSSKGGGKDDNSNPKNSNELSTSSTARTGRSCIKVENICCALEVPAIKRIIRPIDGVSNVLINVSIKTVYIDHDYDKISADEICDILKHESFPAKVEYDAEIESKEKMASSSTTYVTSVFTLLLKEKAEEENQQPHKEEEDVGDVLQLSQKCEQVRGFLGTYELDEIESFFLVDYKQESQSPPRLTVVHNLLLVSAKDLVESFKDKTDTNWTIEKNGIDNKKWEFPLATEGQQQEEIVSSSKNNGLPHPAVILSGIFWVISMFSIIGGNWDYLKYVALLSVALGIPSILIKAIRTLRRLQFDTNCLMLFAVIGALALEEFTEAAAVTFLYALSDWLEVRATTRAREALSSIVQLRPETANLIHPETKELVLVPAVAVPIGFLVCIKAGDKIPCDCTVVEGSSTVDESSLTGESRPVQKGPKDTLSGGTINSGNTQLIGRVTSTSEDSAVARLIRLVEEAQTKRSATEQLVEKFASIYTPLVLFAALLMCSIPWAWGREIGMKWTHNGLVLIVIACPCALIISTPVSYVAGLASTAQKGVLVKGGAYLEALGLVKKICFDKTGTLTKGKFQMLHLNVISDGTTRKEMLEFLYLMEERATHPMAQALVEGVKNENVQTSKLSLFVKDHTFLAGEGVFGIINDKQVYVGNTRLFKRLNMYDDLSEDDKRTVGEWEAFGGTIGFMSIGDADTVGSIVCAYCVMDAVRPEARQSLAQLKQKYGIDAYMLTGDQRKAAFTIGKQVGLSDGCIKSELLPEEKLTIVESFKDELSKQRGRVMMVGDGVNDAPALATADIGVAMGEGAALAMETADVTLIDSHLNKLVYSITMGRRVISKIQQNIVFSLVVKFVILGFAVGGKVELWMAILVDVGSMLLVTLNSMSLIPRKKKQKETVKHTPDIQSDESFEA